MTEWDRSWCWQPDVPVRQHYKVKKPVATRTMVSENIAGLVGHYYSNTEEGGLKRLKTRDFVSVHRTD